MRRDKSDRMGSRAVKIVPGAPCQPLLWTRPQKGLGDLRPPTSVPHSILSEILLAGGSWKESALFAGSVALMAAAVSKPFAQPATGIVKGNIAEEARQTPQAAAPLSLPPVVKLTTEDIWRQADLEDLDREGDGEGEEEWRRWEIPVRQPQSSLQALSASGRRQLLASSLEAVKRAVAAIPEEAERATLGEWRERVSNLLLEASADAATEWLGRPLPSLQRPVGNGENEKGTRHGGLKSAAIVPSDDKAERVAEREGAPGPLDLVAEKSLVHAVMLRDLRFKAVSCVDSPQHAVILAAAPAVVQDIVVTVADSVADALLEEVRQHPEPTEELTVRHMDWPDVLHPRITSTRSIERFCNQVRPKPVRCGEERMA